MVKNWIFIISLFLIGCFSESSGNLDDLIPRDSFKSILIDIEKNQELFQLEPSISQINTSDSVFLESILMDHNYSMSRYEKTLLLYIDRPEEMLKLLNEVKDSLAS